MTHGDAAMGTPLLRLVFLARLLVLRQFGIRIALCHVCIVFGP